MSAGLVRYPSLAFSRVSNGASILVTTFAKIQTAIIQIEQDMLNAKGGVSTLATYLNNTLSADGQLVALTHGILASVTSSQHHGRSHATGHRTTDAFWASTGASGGLISGTNNSRIVNSATQAGQDPWLMSFYKGNAFATSYIQIGFRPAIVNVQWRTRFDWTPAIRNRREWEVMDGVTYLMAHPISPASQAATLARHRRPKASLLIHVSANGFHAKGAVFQDAISFVFFAIREG